jgi:hypothetical protein
MQRIFRHAGTQAPANAIENRGPNAQRSEIDPDNDAHGISEGRNSQGTY